MWFFLGTLNDRISASTDSRFEMESNVIKINNVLEKDEGRYECNASNGIGEGISHAFILSVLGK